MKTVPLVTSGGGRKTVRHYGSNNGRNKRVFVDDHGATDDVGR